VKEFLYKGIIYSPVSSINLEGKRNLFIQLKHLSKKDNGKENFTKALMFILDDISEE
jgi:hypothetical protein